MGLVLKIIGGLVVLLVVVVVGGVIVLKSLDFNDYKDVLAEQVKEFTGRDLTISGDLKVEISLNPSIAVEGLSFANAAWGSRPQMITLGRLATEVELLPLLFGDIRVKRLVLVGLDVLLETDPSGHGNWEIAPPAPEEKDEEKKEAKKKAGDGGLLPVVQKVRLEDVKLVYRDGVSGRLTTVLLESLEVTADSASSPLQVAVRGQYNGLAYAASGRLGAVTTLIDDEPFPVSLTVDALDAKVGIDGSIAKPRQAQGLDLKISLQGADLTRTVEAAKALVPGLKGVAVPPIGPFKVAVRITGSAEKLAVAGLDASVGQAGQILITARGDIGDAIALSGLDVTVAAQGPDLAATVKMVRPLVPALKAMAVPDLGPYDVAATVRGSLKKLSVSGIKASVGQAGKVLLTAAGEISDAIALSGLNVTVAAQGPDLAATVKMVRPLVPALKGVPVPDLGPYDGTATVRGSLKKLSVSGIKVAVGRAQQVRLTASGSVADAITAKGLELTFAVEGKDLSPLSAALDAPLPAPLASLPPFTVAGRLKDGGGGFAVDGLKAVVGASDVSGQVAVNLAGARPAIDADLTSVMLNLDEILAPQKPKQPKKKDKAAAAAKKAKAKAKGDGRVFPADPLPLDGLRAVDARVTFRGKRIIAQGMIVDDVSVALTLKGGRLHIKPFGAVLSGGRISGTVLLDGAGKTPRLALKVKAKQVDYGALLKQMDATDMMTGKADLEVDIRGSGGSVRAIMAGLNGRLRLAGQGGRVNSTVLNILSADVFSILPGSASKGDKDIRCIVAEFHIESGLARHKALIFETGGLTMIGRGTVNLADETLNLKFDPRAKKASILQASVPFSVGGTIASPSVAVNVTGVAAGALKTVTGVATDIAKGGVNLLGALTGGGKSVSTDATDYCMLALAGKPLVPSQTAAPAPAQAPPTRAAEDKSLPEKTLESVDKTLQSIGEGIGSALKNLFGN